MGLKNSKEITIGSCAIYIDDLHVGYTGDEVKVSVAREVQSFLSGLPQVPITSVVTKEECSVEFEFAQISAVNLAYALGKDGNIDPITVPGEDILEFGGDTSLGTTHKLDLVHTFPDDRALRIILWKAMPEPTFEMAFASGKFLGITSKWSGMEDSSRVAGKRICRMQIEKEIKS
jgi:hypothetical protein